MIKTLRASHEVHLKAWDHKVLDLRVCGFRVSGFRVQGLGFRVSRFRVQGLGFRGFGSRVLRFAGLRGIKFLAAEFRRRGGEVLKP